ALQLGLGEVDHGHPRPEERERGRLLSATAGQAEHWLAAQVPQPARGIDPLARRGGVELQRGAREERVGFVERPPALDVVARGLVHGRSPRSSCPKPAAHLLYRRAPSPPVAPAPDQAGRTASGSRNSAVGGRAAIRSSCRARIARPSSAAWRTQEMFSSEPPCAMARMLQPWRPSVPKTRPATPGVPRIPAPTTARMQTSRSTV